MVASLYPDNKTGRLNAVHAWWPGGLVIGGLLGVGMSHLGLGWQMKLGVVFLPAVALIALCAGMKFPPTERAAAGVTTKEMFRELANPLFMVLFASMFLTAASELAPGQWVDLALSRTVHMPGILLLVYVSGLMFLMRNFAGPLVHKFSSIGVLWLSCLGAALGLYALSVANSPVTALLAATLWGTGVCYMWPTMLATASERFPRGGALLMGLMGTAGTLSIQFVLPIMGSIFDHKKIELAGGTAAFDALPPGPELDRMLGIAAQTSFRDVALLPAISAAGLRRYLVLRPLPRRLSSAEAIAHDVARNASDRRCYKIDAGGVVRRLGRPSIHMVIPLLPGRRNRKPSGTPFGSNWSGFSRALCSARASASRICCASSSSARCTVTAEPLKERTLGVEVFGRAPDYDTNLDPVVRTTAVEIRKRIAQYYHEEGHQNEIRIDFPAGSYLPEFRMPEKPAVLAEPARRAAR